MYKHIRICIGINRYTHEKYHVLETVFASASLYKRHLALTHEIRLMKTNSNWSFDYRMSNPWWSFALVFCLCACCLKADRFFFYSSFISDLGSCFHRGPRGSDSCAPNRVQQHISHRHLSGADQHQLSCSHQIQRWELPEPVAQTHIEYSNDYK